MRFIEVLDDNSRQVTAVNLDQVLTITRLGRDDDARDDDRARILMNSGPCLITVRTNESYTEVMLMVEGRTLSPAELGEEDEEDEVPDTRPGAEPTAPLFRLVSTPISVLPSTDLQQVYWEQINAGMEALPYRIEAHGQVGAVLYVPHLGRAGVALGADALWTDAESAEDAVQRYFEGRMVQ